MTLFEHLHRGDLWRFEVTEHRGRTFANWRRWFKSGDEWKPSRQGCTFPLERLPELGEAVADYLRQSERVTVAEAQRRAS